MKTRRGDTTRRHREKVTPTSVSVSPDLRVPLITLLTDFGTADYFVSALKAVILSANPQACIVDITHDIPLHDIESAAFTLMAACASFPTGTIHVAVVDPGVGSSRRAILIRTRGQFFVGPDNGIFSYVCESCAKTPPEIFHLTKEQYFRQPVSATFNGRDVFAPIAAALSLGVKPESLGTEVSDLVRLQPLAPVVSRAGRLSGRIVHIDRFGNCVTNITPNELTPQLIADGARLRVKGKVVKSFRNYFAEEIGKPNRLFAVWGSAGFLEVVVANESAAKLLNAKRGDPVIIVTK